MKTLRLFFLTFLILLITLSAWATPRAVTPVKHPAIEIQEPVYTFPEVLDGKKVVHDFIVKNTGDAVLKIKKVDTT